jgi:hypothetical protein
MLKWMELNGELNLIATLSLGTRPTHQFNLALFCLIRWHFQITVIMIITRECTLYQLITLVEFKLDEHQNQEPG